MLITFRSKAGGDVLMLAQHAQPLLQAAGKSVTDGVPERGVWTAAQLDAAIAGIESATASADDPHDAHHQDDDPDQPALHPVEQPVGLRQRAYPLLNLMRQARDAQTEVDWETAAPW